MLSLLRTSIVHVIPSFKPSRYIPICFIELLLLCLILLVALLFESRLKPLLEYGTMTCFIICYLLFFCFIIYIRVSPIPLLLGPDLSLCTKISHYNAQGCKTLDPMFSLGDINKRDKNVRAKQCPTGTSSLTETKQWSLRTPTLGRFYKRELNLKKTKGILPNKLS